MGDDGFAGWEAGSLLTFVRLHQGVCSYRFERTVAAKLHHPAIYSSLNLGVLRRLKGAHALALYENCHRYIGAGQTPAWPIEVLRRLLAVERGYPEFKFFKRDVIQRAMREVNTKSNIEITPKYQKAGRVISTVQFSVIPNTGVQLTLPEADNSKNPTSIPKPLSDLGVSNALARSWIKKHGETYVLQKCDLTRRCQAAGKIKASPLGFLRSAIERNFLDEAAEQTSQIAEQRDMMLAKTRAEQKLNALSSTLRSLENDYRHAMANNIEAFLEKLPECVQTDITLDVSQSLRSRFHREAFARFGWYDRLSFPGILSYWAALGMCFPSQADWALQNGYPDPEGLRAEIAQIQD